MGTHRACNAESGVRIPVGPPNNGGIAQLGEHLAFNQNVLGSNPSAPTKNKQGELVWSFQRMPEEHDNQVRFLDLAPEYSILSFAHWTRWGGVVAAIPRVLQCPLNVRYVGLAATSLGLECGEIPTGDAKMLGSSSMVEQYPLKVLVGGSSPPSLAKTTGATQVWANLHGYVKQSKGRPTED